MNRSRQSSTAFSQPFISGAVFAPGQQSHAEHRSSKEARLVPAVRPLDRGYWPMATDIRTLKAITRGKALHWFDGMDPCYGIQPMKKEKCHVYSLHMKGLQTGFFSSLDFPVPKKNALIVRESERTFKLQSFRFNFGVQSGKLSTVAPGMHGWSVTSSRARNHRTAQIKRTKTNQPERVGAPALLPMKGCARCFNFKRAVRHNWEFLSRGTRTTALILRVNCIGLSCS